jgi:nitrogen regulatory protein P-II 1
MRKIEAIIRNQKLDSVKAALEKIGVLGLNVTEVQGRGHQKGVTRQWRGAAYLVDMLPKTKLDIVVKEEDVDRVIDVIVRAAWTGDIGDGKIFVLPVDEVVRIRTGERGEEAI